MAGSFSEWTPGRTVQAVLEPHSAYPLQGIAALPESDTVTSVSPLVAGGAVVVTAVLSGCLAYLYVVDVSAGERQSIRATLLTVVAPLLFVFVLIVLASVLTGS